MTKTCRHCTRPLLHRAGRGLCRTCWNDPTVRDRYAPLVPRTSGRPENGKMSHTDCTLVSLALSVLRTDGGTQARVRIDDDAVADYADAYAAQAPMPPAVAFYDGTDYWLADGFHRRLGAQQAGREAIEVQVYQGTRNDAIWYACGANRSHGLRRTNQDKRQAVLVAVQLRPQLSNRALADHCGVSHVLVADVRSPLEESSSQPDFRVGLDGRTIDTSNIGKRTDDVPPPYADPDMEPDLEPTSNGYESAEPEEPTGEIPKSAEPDPEPDEPQPAPPSVFCERCQRVGPVKGCQACLDLKGKKPPAPRPKNGSVLYDWKRFYGHWGSLYREIDVLGSAYHAKESQDAEQCRRALAAFKNGFRVWYQNLTGTKAPE